MSLEANIKAALEKIGDYYIVELKNNIETSGHVASKDLLKSIKKSGVSSSAVSITANRYLGAYLTERNIHLKAPHLKWCRVSVDG